MEDEQHDERERHKEGFEVKVIRRWGGSRAERGVSVYVLKREEDGDQEAQVRYVGAERTVLSVTIILSREAPELAFALEGKRTHNGSTAYPPGREPMLVERVIGMFGYS